MAYRIDRGVLGRAERVAAGGIRLPAAIGRTGTLTYRRADGSTWVEYRPPEEAFAEDSLASLRGAPVTDLHPAGPVTPATYRDVARGHVGDDARADDDEHHIAASIYVQDAALLAAVEAGQRVEVSAGYQTRLDETPGTAPDGTHYDAIQRGIAYNHVALGPRGWGRAGATVALRLDAAMDVVDVGDADDGDREQIMKVTIKVDGVDYTCDVDETAARALPAALERERADAARIQAELRTERDAAKADADAAKGRADALEATAATGPETLRSLVTARVALERRALAVAPTLVCDGLSDRELMAKAIGFEATENHSDDYVTARFDAFCEQISRADGSVARARVATATTGERLSIAEEARRRYLDRQAGGGN